MIRRGTWILLGVFVTFLAFSIWWTEFRPGEAEPSFDLTPAPEALWPESEILRVRIVDRKEGAVVEARRDAEDLWVLLRPEPGPADVARMERAVSWLEAPSPISVVTDPGDLAVFELLEPRATITVFWATGGQRTMEVGRDAPTGEAIYVRLPGDPNV